MLLVLPPRRGSLPTKPFFSRNKEFKNDNDEVCKIKKVLEKSDVGNMNRLMLRRDKAEEYVLPVFGMWTPTPCTLLFSRDGSFQEAMSSLAIGLKILLQEGA